MENPFVEFLKTRQQEAARKLQVAQVQLQQAQLAFNQAQQQATSWTIALQTELQRAQQEAAAAARPVERAEPTAQSSASADEQPPSPPPLSPPNVKPTSANEAAEQIASAPEINKTILVRNVLSQHPDGITPVEIFKELKNQVSAAYVHSVLHRLKERDEIVKRRGKYSLKQHSQSQSESPNGVVVQHR